MFKLKRVDKVWQKPAAWLAQGSAVHFVIEAWEKSGRTIPLENLKELFREAYKRFAEDLLDDTPNLSYWYASGQYTADLDLPRRFEKGLEQVEKYVEYYTQKAPKEVLWIAPDGTPGCELDFTIDLEGIPVHGFLDEIIVHPRHGLIVRDVKTGNTPGDTFQLAVYAIAANEIHELDIDKGDYWMGRTGKPTILYDLSEWTKQDVTTVFRDVDAEIRAGLFEPKPEEDKCRFCPVQRSCEYAAV